MAYPRVSSIGSNACHSNEEFIKGAAMKEKKTLLGQADRNSTTASFLHYNK